MARTIFAFNGDLESRLALHWLVHERGEQVLAVSLDVGQGIYLEPLGEIALELGASSSLILDRRSEFLNSFALPVLQAGAVYQGGCSLGSALSRYLIAKELVRIAHEEGANRVAHSAASKGNDQVRLEAALAALDPRLEVVVPARLWNLRTLEAKLNYARRRRLPIEEPSHSSLSVDRNLWGASLYYYALPDPWDAPPPDIFVLTRSPQEAPDQPAVLTLGFEEGMPRRLNGQPVEPLDLVAS